MIALVLAAAVAVATATGSWNISADGSTPRMEMSWSDASNSYHNSDVRSIDPRLLGIASALASNGTHVQFALHREAGEFAFEGWVAKGNGGGTYTFTPNVAFFDDMRARGFTLDPQDPMGREMSAAELDITRAYVEDMQRAGISLDFHQLLTFRALGITSAYVADLASVGFSHLETRQYVTFKALKIDGAYVKYLQAHGFRNLTAREVISLKAQQI